MVVFHLPFVETANLRQSIHGFGLKSRALSCDIAASASGPAVLFFDFPLTSLPKFQPWACPPPVPNPELPEGLGSLGAENGLVKTEAVGQGREGHALEIIRQHEHLHRA